MPNKIKYLYLNVSVEGGHGRISCKWVTSYMYMISSSFTLSWSVKWGLLHVYFPDLSGLGIELGYSAGSGTSFVEDLVWSSFLSLCERVLPTSLELYFSFLGWKFCNLLLKPKAVMAQSTSSDGVCRKPLPYSAERREGGFLWNGGLMISDSTLTCSLLPHRILYYLFV